MKTIKKISVLILTLVIAISSFSVSTSAYDYRIPWDFVPWEYEPQRLDDEHSAVSKAIELYNYCDTLATYYNLWGYFERFPETNTADFKYGFISAVDGGIALRYDYDSAEALGTAIKNVYLDVYQEEWKPDFEQKADNEFFLSYYRELQNAAKEMEINNFELAFLIKICDTETNDDSYYSDDLWEQFTTALNNAKAAYNKNTLNGTENIHDGAAAGNTRLYWDLYFAYNKLCMQITTPGDINGNGEVEVLDVTLLQRSLAGITPELHAAQRCAACVQDHLVYDRKRLYPTILDATFMQRKLAEIDGVGLFHNTIYEEYMECMCYEVNSIVQHEVYFRHFPGYYN